MKKLPFQKRPKKMHLHHEVTLQREKRVVDSVVCYDKSGILKERFYKKRYNAFLSRMTDFLHLKLLYLANKLEIAKSASVMSH